MSNSEIARVLQETADLLELTGGNPHRARAFSRAARSLGNLQDSAVDRLGDGTLTDVSGIGEAMADHVAEIAGDGSFDLHDELLSSVPPGLMDVMQVKGLGTKRTRRLWIELDVTSLDDLEQAAKNDQVTTLDGFGAKTQQNILENVRQLRRYNERWRLAEAWAATEPFLQDLRTEGAVERAEFTGALRRHRETVEYAEVLAATEQPNAVQDWARARLKDPTARNSSSQIEGTLEEGVPVRLHLISPGQFGTAWWRTTGSPAHCTAFEDTCGAPAPHAREEGVFAEANLPVIPPELREDRGEFDLAGDSPPALLTQEDLHGCLHNHSTYSDGSNSLREMAEAAQDRGFSYFGICDHSQSLRIAEGLSPEEVQRQRAEVDRLNEDFAEKDPQFRVFHGIESDILRDGSLDYDTDVLDTFDFVVASIHTGFNMTEEEATQRLVRAVENPYTRILGHPTGRLLLQREGYPVDHARVIDACAEHGVALELNANPYRLDLDWRWIRRATSQGALVSINPDAHAAQKIDYLRWGVAVGRKGWLTPDQCLNAKSLEDFTQWLDEEGP
ncbi:MAG: DNA polymerase/3'-5' exonuclease PolX [Salinibacter sp.]|uniref:DNA polymerase/3'-5' exonuclease PolX n=1 Tax=Salinibacter sp. TaxID=2065818 RepID=UPI0035D42834